MGMGLAVCPAGLQSRLRAKMVLNGLAGQIPLQLLTRDYYATFSSKQIADAHATSEVLLALTSDSREGVDAVVFKLARRPRKRGLEAESRMERSDWLLTAGIMNVGAALLHLACIAGGPRWYRFLGAGEQMVRLAERGSSRPALITVVIAAVLCGGASYAFSGAGLLPRLPLLRPALIAVFCVYMLRAAALPLMLARMPDRSPTFHVWSSFIVLGFALVHGCRNLAQLGFSRAMSIAIRSAGRWAIILQASR